jgi:hypothetical protein
LLNLISPSGGGKWAELPDEGATKITNFFVLEKKIAGYNSKFTATPLRVDIYSPDVVDLRLVDLPGLVHVPCQSNLTNSKQNPTEKQPQDLREQIKVMVKSYIEYL